MASITVTLTGSCATNNHVALAVTGDKTGTLRLHVDDVFQQPVDNEALINFLMQYLKIWSVGKTRAQMRTQLLAGVTITI
jgi:hypothetical protein